MKTDDESEEAEEPPGKPPSSECSVKTSVDEENEELEWARRHVPPGRIKQPEPGTEQIPGPEVSPPAAKSAVRKTELWNRPPLFRSEETVLRQKGLDRQVDEIHDRIDILEDWIGLVIDQLERRISKLEERRES